MMFEDVDTRLKQRIDSLIEELQDRITEPSRAMMPCRRPPVFSALSRGLARLPAMLPAELPEIGAITGEQAAALTGMAPVAQDSGSLRGKRAITRGRRALRQVMFQAALVAAYHNPSLKSFAEGLRKAGKPREVIITAVARRLVTIANALCKSRHKWAPQKRERCSC